MNYEEFIENYVPELQLLDAIDELKNYSFEAAETIDRLVSLSSSAKTDAAPPQTGPMS